MQIKPIITFLAITLGLLTQAQEQKYKVLLQLTKYAGDGAYVAVSLINPQGNYEQTLYMHGDDPQWYNTLKRWFSFTERKKEKIDAITGASITNGDRKIFYITLSESVINKGYTIRFESAVEDQNYHTIDAQVELSSEKMFEKTAGTGYIRYVKIINPI